MNTEQQKIEYKSLQKIRTGERKDSKNSPPLV